MDRQAVFKKISKVLIPIEITFVVASTVFAGAIFYFALNEIIKTNEVDLKQFYQNLAVSLIIIAIFSIILTVYLVFSTEIFSSEDRNKVKKTIILSISVFMVIILSLLYLFTLFQYRYFPLIFFGSAIITVLFKFLALVPNGLRDKSKQLLLKLKQFIFLRLFERR